MDPRALGGATLGAALGAVVWAAITYFTGYEVGYVAWAVGGAVGGGAALLGGRGQMSGLVCAALALAAIFVGKLGATHFLAQKNFSAAAALFTTQAVYEEWASDAAEFAELDGEAAYPAFMVKHGYGYGEAESPEDVTPEEVLDFKQYSVPRLKKMGVPPVPYSEWSRAERDYVIAEMTKGFSLVEDVKASLGAVDVIFALLGLATAFQLGANGFNVSEA